MIKQQTYGDLHTSNYARPCTRSTATSTATSTRLDSGNATGYHDVSTSAVEASGLCGRTVIFRSSAIDPAHAVAR
jgi:hypothetical protein